MRRRQDVSGLPPIPHGTIRQIRQAIANVITFGKSNGISDLHGHDLFSLPQSSAKTPEFDKQDQHVPKCPLPEAQTSGFIATGRERDCPECECACRRLRPPGLLQPVKLLQRLLRHRIAGGADLRFHCDGRAQEQADRPPGQVIRNNTRYKNQPGRGLTKGSGRREYERSSFSGP